MPIPSDVLSAWQSASLYVQVSERGDEVVLPPASAADRGPGHFLLWPSAWFVSAGDPLGVPASEQENARLHAQLLTSVGQSGIAALPARLRGPGLQLEGLLLRGAGRARAMQLGYKRRQWAVLGVFPDRMEVVYTGINSRMQED